jgi:hypothetical protein
MEISANLGEQVEWTIVIKFSLLISLTFVYKFYIFSKLHMCEPSILTSNETWYCESH